MDKRTRASSHHAVAVVPYTRNAIFAPWLISLQAALQVLRACLVQRLATSNRNGTPHMAVCGYPFPKTFSNNKRHNLSISIFKDRRTGRAWCEFQFPQSLLVHIRSLWKAIAPTTTTTTTCVYPISCSIVAHEYSKQRCAMCARVYWMSGPSTSSENTMRVDGQINGV